MTALFSGLAGGVLRGFLRTPFGLAVLALIVLAVLAAVQRHLGRSEMAAVARARAVELVALRQQAARDAARLARLEAATTRDAQQIERFQGERDAKNADSDGCRIRVKRLR